MQQIIITSQNPVKVNAVRSCFTKVFADHEFEYISVNVSSDVPDQPFGDEQTLLGAKNRVKHARVLYPNATIVGLEGGVTIDEQGIGWSYARIYIESSSQVGFAKTAMLQLPPKIVELLQQGMELGPADDIVFGTTNSKQQMGSVGLLTQGHIDRVQFYEHACVLALAPFLNSELY